MDFGPNTREMQRCPSRKGNQNRSADGEKVKRPPWRRLGWCRWQNILFGLALGISRAHY
jgi:hypothetical protein